MTCMVKMGNSYDVGCVLEGADYGKGGQCWCVVLLVSNNPNLVILDGLTWLFLLNLLNLSLSPSVLPHLFPSSFLSFCISLFLVLKFRN